LFLKSHPCALNEPRFGIFRPANGEIHAEYFWVFQTRNDWGTSRPCLLPPMAVKSKPPAVRVVVDSACRIYAYNPPDGFGVVPIGGGISLF
jgi:hypothetical protein